MAQPSRKPDFNAESKPSWQPRIIEGGGEGGDGERPALRAIPGGGQKTSEEETPQAPQKRHLSLVPPLKEAEAQATGPSDKKASLANQETGANLGDAKSLYEKSRKNRKAGGPRGIFIGLGAGGGIVSVIAGFAFMLPFKMPGIMDTLIGDAGKRLEKVVERRAERVFLQFMLRGTKAAELNGNLIITGNPLGDYFANLKTANFEADLRDQFGLEFKPGPNKTVTLVHDGRDLGNANSPDDILKILDSGGSLSRSDLRKIIRSTQAWPFYKRVVFVKWLRLKYNIPRFGAREIEPGEKEEDYNKAVKEDHILNIEQANFTNAADFITCVSNSGECPEADKTGTANGFIDRTKKAFTETAKELALTGVRKSITNVIQAALPKIVTQSASLVIPYVGEIDIAARIVHGLGVGLRGDLLQKKHAEYIGRTSAVVGATYAGYSDQTKAGELPASTVGMFADNFDGWETSVSYGLINGGKPTGERLPASEQVGETFTSPEHIAAMKVALGYSVSIIGAPLEAWYYTVSQLFDLAGNITGSAAEWIMTHTPAAALLEKLTPHIATILEGLLKVIGFSIDPLAVGAKLAMYIHQGFLVSFNAIAKELGMRFMSHSQARAIDTQIRNDRLADLADKPLFERLFDLNSNNSLASTLATTIPSGSSPVLAFATTSTRLVASVPDNVARLSTGTAYAAAEGEVTSEELFGVKAYGGTEADLSAELHPSTYSSGTVTCPENNDNAFNHCKFDPTVVQALNCQVVKCPEMNPGAASSFDTMFVDSNQSFYRPLSHVSEPFLRVSQLLNDLMPAMVDTKRGV